MNFCREDFLYDSNDLYKYTAEKTEKAKQYCFIRAKNNAAYLILKKVSANRQND